MLILAVDYGTKRIGLAIGDQQGLVVRAVRTVPSLGLKRDAHQLIGYARALGSEKIVVGQPLNPSGAPGPAARRSQKLVAQLRKLTDLPVVLWDERLTSRAADQWMDERGITSGRRQSLRDQVAACLILEDYLSHVPHQESRTRF